MKIAVNGTWHAPTTYVAATRGCAWAILRAALSSLHGVALAGKTTTPAIWPKTFRLFAWRRGGKSVNIRISWRSRPIS
ncbi:MAG: hypothetical protein ACOC44_13095 [Promethearchaeia archaeon]